MPRIEYVPKKFNADHTLIIERANAIIAEYREQGFDLTLRQLYYQFVSRDFLANNQRNYKKLGSVISDARRAGLVDWEAIVDRTRNLQSPNSWGTPADIVGACARQFDVDWWKNQKYRPEVWVEKDALLGVIETACEPWHCPFFSCRGYTSDSEVWGAAQRMANIRQRGQTPIVFHLGDHDPSGIDMTRDIGDRLRMFAGGKRIEIRRLALNMPQIEEYQPPPNPAKTTDSRYEGYEEEHGDESWELDALSPTVIAEIIATEMETIVDTVEFAERATERDEGRRLLGQVSEQWNELTEGL